jgi:MarR family transcriptional regulator, organic hydroperoxide resistance regulator
MTTDDFIFDTADASPGFLLWQVTNIWQRGIRKILEPYNITHTQFVLLASIHWLTLHKMEVTQRVVSNHTKVDPMTTSTVLRTLEKKWLIERQVHEIDTRSMKVCLTNEGMKLVKATVTVVETFDLSFFARLDEDLPMFHASIWTLIKK